MLVYGLVLLVCSWFNVLLFIGMFIGMVVGGVLGSLVLV